MRFEMLGIKHKSPGSLIVYVMNCKCHLCNSPQLDLSNRGEVEWPELDCLWFQESDGVFCFTTDTSRQVPKDDEPHQTATNIQV